MSNSRINTQGKEHPKIKGQLLIKILIFGFIFPLNGIITILVIRALCFGIVWLTCANTGARKTMIIRSEDRQHGPQLEVNSIKRFTKFYYFGATVYNKGTKDDEINEILAAT